MFLFQPQKDAQALCVFRPGGFRLLLAYIVEHIGLSGCSTAPTLSSAVAVFLLQSFHDKAIPSYNPSLLRGDVLAGDTQANAKNGGASTEATVVIASFSGVDGKQFILSRCNGRPATQRIVLLVKREQCRSMCSFVPVDFFILMRDKIRRSSSKPMKHDRILELNPILFPRYWRKEVYFLWTILLPATDENLANGKLDLL